MVVDGPAKRQCSDAWAPVRAQATEIRFDLVTAVDELAAQLQQEFDFRREAETMDTIRARLRWMKGFRVPEPCPGLAWQTLYQCWAKPANKQIQVLSGISFPQSNLAAR